MSDKRILVRAPNWIGDQVLAYPFFVYLRKTHPRAHIAVACLPWVESLQFRGLIDQVITLDRPLTSRFRDRLNAVIANGNKLRDAGPWDEAYSLPNSLSSAWMLFRSGAKVRRGYAAEGRGFLLNASQKWDPSPGIHRAQAYINLLPKPLRPGRAVQEFWGVPPNNELDDPVPGELDVFAADQEWRGKALEPPTEKYWVLAPGATADSRRWSAESFIALAKMIHRKTGMKGLIVGGPSEAFLAEELAKVQDAGLEDWCARGPVKSLWKVFRGAQFTVTNESGLAHVAALCGSFVQIVCGAADPRRTRPLGPGKVQVAVNPVACWPCERNQCVSPAEGVLQCLKGIQPTLVWEEIQRGTAH